MVESLIEWLKQPVDTTIGTMLGQWVGGGMAMAAALWLVGALS